MAEVVATEQFDTTSIKNRKQELEEELGDQKTLIDNLVKAQNTKPMLQEDFLRKYNRYTEKFSEIKKAIETLRKEEEMMFGKSVIFRKKIEELKKTNEISEFNDIIFTAFVGRIVAHSDGTLDFKFMTGQILTSQIA